MKSLILTTCLTCFASISHAADPRDSQILMAFSFGQWSVIYCYDQVTEDIIESVATLSTLFPEKEKEIALVAVDTYLTSKFGDNYSAACAYLEQSQKPDL